MNTPKQNRTQNLILIQSRTPAPLLRETRIAHFGATAYPAPAPRISRLKRLIQFWVFSWVLRALVLAQACMPPRKSNPPPSAHSLGNPKS